MRVAHCRHFIFTERPATRSSAIWYFALQLGQTNFIQPSERASIGERQGEDSARPCPSRRLFQRS